MCTRIVEMDRLYVMSWSIFGNFRKCVFLESVKQSRNWSTDSSTLGVEQLVSRTQARLYRQKDHAAKQGHARADWRAGGRRGTIP